MGALDVPVVGVGTDHLDEYLSSDRSPPESMGLSDLDGFLTGIAIGPELLMPSEWVPVVWGGEDAVFDGDGEAQAVMGSIFIRYNEILNEVEHGTFEPILLTTADGATIASDWAEGFLEAIRLRPKAWQPLFESKEHGTYFWPILALCSDENGEPVLGLGADAMDKLLADAPEVISGCVMEIAAFWRERQAGRAPASATRSTRKTGRNEPCPCGSGKKFKKCCGQAS